MHAQTVQTTVVVQAGHYRGNRLPRSIPMLFLAAKSGVEWEVSRVGFSVALKLHTSVISTQYARVEAGGTGELSVKMALPRRQNTDRAPELFELSLGGGRGYEARPVCNRLTSVLGPAAHDGAKHRPVHRCSTLQMAELLLGCVWELLVVLVPLMVKQLAGEDDGSDLQGSHGQENRLGAFSDAPGENDEGCLQFLCRRRSCALRTHHTTPHHTTPHHTTTHHNTPQHTTTHHNTPQHTTTHHNTPQHNTTQHNTTQHNTTRTQHNTTQHNTTQHNTTQHNTTQHDATTQRRNDATTQRRNDATTQRRNDATTQRRNDATTQRRNDATTPRRRNDTTTQRHNDTRHTTQDTRHKTQDTRQDHTTPHHTTPHNTTQHNTTQPPTTTPPHHGSTAPRQHIPHIPHTQTEIKACSCVHRCSVVDLQHLLRFRLGCACVTHSLFRLVSIKNCVTRSPKRTGNTFNTVTSKVDNSQNTERSAQNGTKPSRRSNTDFPTQTSEHRRQNHDRTRTSDV